MLEILKKYELPRGDHLYPAKRKRKGARQKYNYRVSSPKCNDRKSDTKHNLETDTKCTSREPGAKVVQRVRHDGYVKSQTRQLCKGSDIKVM